MGEEWPAARKEAAAVDTLHGLGFTHAGGVLWKPPLGKPPRTRAELRDALQIAAKYTQWMESRDAKHVTDALEASKQGAQGGQVPESLLNAITWWRYPEGDSMAACANLLKEIDAWLAATPKSQSEPAFEQCAKLCDEVKAKSRNHLFRSGATVCAGEIRAAQPQAKPVLSAVASDDQLIATAEAAGFKWIPPDDDPDGYPGGFDMSDLENMRKLLTHTTPDTTQADVQKGGAT